MARLQLKAWEDFTEKEATLVEAFTNPELPTYRKKLDSYKEAGYYFKGPPEGAVNDGRGDRAAKVRAYELFKKPHIAQEIENRFRREYEALKMSVEETVARVSKMAGVDLMEYLGEVPTICPHCEGELHLGIEYVFDIKRMQKDGYGSILKDMMPTKYGTKFTFYPADQALERLMKHHGVFKEKGDKTVNFIDKAIMLANQQ